jgi:hypothetical protein
MVTNPGLWEQELTSKKKGSTTPNTVALETKPPHEFWSGKPYLKHSSHGSRVLFSSFLGFTLGWASPNLVWVKLLRFRTQDNSHWHHWWAGLWGKVVLRTCPPCLSHFCPINPVTQHQISFCLREQQILQNLAPVTGLSAWERPLPSGHKGSSLWIGADLGLKQLGCAFLPCTYPTPELSMAQAPGKLEVALTFVLWPFKFTQNIHHQTIWLVCSWRNLGSSFLFFLFFLFLVLLEFGLRASHLLGKCSTTWATHPAIFFF